MNRSNVGNVATNAMQIESVSLTTAAKFLGDASSAMNNLSKAERNQYQAMRADKMRDEIADYQAVGKEAAQMRTDKTREQIDTYRAGGESPFQHLSLEEQRAYRQKQAEGIRKYTEYEDDNDNSSNPSVDDLMRSGSPQAQAIATKVSTDNEWLSDWLNRSFKNRNITTRERLDEFRKKIGGDENANV